MERIQAVLPTIVRLDQTVAEVRVDVTVDVRSTTTEVRGRLHGPTCSLASTIEVAYPFQIDSTASSERGTIVPRVDHVETAGPLGGLSSPAHENREIDQSSTKFRLRALIPEPSLWEPSCQFLYRGIVELWEDGHRVERREFLIGLCRRPNPE